jgi:hypothetical protein
MYNYLNNIHISFALPTSRDSDNKARIMQAMRQQLASNCYQLPSNSQRQLATRTTGDWQLKTDN